MASDSSHDAPIWHPATRAQQGLWLIDRIKAQRRSYLIPIVVEFPAVVRHDVLVKTVQHLFDRHPALRSRFRLEPRLRRIEYRTDLKAATVVLTDIATDDWTRPEIDHLINLLCYSPFDLAEEAPCRGEVIRTRQTTYLVLSIHHIVFDGWSREVLMEQLTHLYQAAVEGRIPELPAAVHPADLVAEPAKEDAARQLDETVDWLRDAPTDIELPYDRPRRVGQSAEGTSLALEFDSELTGKLITITAQEGCTTFMLMSALLAATLATMGAQRDFLFVFPWAGRESPAAAHAVGMLISTLVLRISLTGTETWRTFLRNTRLACFNAFTSAGTPFDALAAALDPQRDATRPPVSPVLVTALDRRPPQALALSPEVSGRYVPPYPLHVKYELALSAFLEEERLTLSIEYPTALFDSDTIAGILAALRCSATRLTLSPESPVLEPLDAAPLDLRTAMEYVRQAWGELLETDEIAVDVNFFDAGGDSVLLALLTERLTDLTGQHLDDAALFRAGTMRGQAALLLGDVSPPVRRGADPDRLLNLARRRSSAGKARSDADD